MWNEKEKDMNYTRKFPHKSPKDCEGQKSDLSESEKESKRKIK